MEADEDRSDGVGVESTRRGILRELLVFLGRNRRWGPLPIVLVLPMLAALLLAGPGAAVPFLVSLACPVVCLVRFRTLWTMARA